MLVKLCDIGIFYYMILENLNVVEWIIWWLCVFKIVG